MVSRRLTDYIRMVTSSTAYHPDGTKTVQKSPAVWTLAHRGYSGGGRLDVWVYPTKADALRAGAQLALACGLDELNPETIPLYHAGRYQAVLDRYEATHREGFLLRVQPAFLTPEPPQD